jgi:hypothetical protein
MSTLDLNLVRFVWRTANREALHRKSRDQLHGCIGVLANKKANVPVLRTS